MATERVWPDVTIPPGDVLAEELEARGLTQSRLARLMHRPLQAINEIVRGRKRITGATALGLADALGTSAELWIRLEADYELNKARLARRPEPRRRTRAHAPLGRAEATRKAASSSDPLFLKRVEAARRALRAGKGVRLEELPR
jgi:addiction module HigA family antidote